MIHWLFILMLCARWLHCSVEGSSLLPSQLQIEACVGEIIVVAYEFLVGGELVGLERWHDLSAWR